jgi:YD repeat-containing protein
LNRLTSKTYPDTTAVDYVYDLVGKITQVNDPTGTYAFAYDNMGRLIGTTTSYSFLTGRSFTNAYTYDAASNRAGFTDPESGSTTYTIDGASYTLDSAGNRTAKVDQLAAVTSNYTYDAIYQLTQVTQGGSTTESYSYDTCVKTQRGGWALTGFDLAGAPFFASRERWGFFILCWSTKLHPNQHKQHGASHRQDDEQQPPDRRSFTNAYTYDATCDTTSNHIGFIAES